MADNLQKLILGTAQFGLNYGISNAHGQIKQAEAEAILNRAALAGITTLDTAAAYGDSETCIGEALCNKSSFKIISKYPPNSPDLSIEVAFMQSLERLKQEKLYGYLLHSFSSYQSNPKVLDELLKLKEDGKVDKIGVSLYHPHEAEALLGAGAPIDIVQFPYSVFDRRFETILPELRSKNFETHVRSIYLQGLYFMQPSSLPAYLQNAASKVEKLQNLALEQSMPLGAMLMGFVLQHKHITNVVIGVENKKTLEENISFSSATLNSTLLKALQDFEEQDEDIILPYNWAKA